MAPSGCVWQQSVQFLSINRAEPPCWTCCRMEGQTVAWLLCLCVPHRCRNSKPTLCSLPREPSPASPRHSWLVHSRKLTDSAPKLEATPPSPLLSFPDLSPRIPHRPPPWKHHHHHPTQTRTLQSFFWRIQLPFFPITQVWGCGQKSYFIFMFFFPPFSISVLILLI